MGKPRKQWRLPLSEVLRRYGEGESSTVLAQECGLGNVRPILQAIRDAGMEVRSPYSGLRPRKRDPRKRETRTCRRDGCENTFDVYVSNEQKYCTSECRFADPQLRDKISESNTTHKLSDVDESRMTATCSICGPEMKIIKGSRARSDGRSRYSCWLAGKTWHWAKRYGVTVVDVMTMLDSQDGKCGICAKKLDTSFCVDHDHDTGKVRGLLCHNCNKGLGLLGDSTEAVEAALKYLRGLYKASPR